MIAEDDNAIIEYYKSIIKTVDYPYIKAQKVDFQKIRCEVSSIQ